MEVIDPFKAVYVNHDRFDKDYMDQMAPQSAICMGLAIRKVDDK